MKDSDLFWLAAVICLAPIAPRWALWIGWAICIVISVSLRWAGK